MTTVSELNKVKRGTKRVCQACEVRFYDLGRNPIVCPACQAQYTPIAAPLFEPTARGNAGAGKTGWRSKSFARPEAAPTVPVAEVETEAADEIEVEVEEAVEAAPAEDIVIEEDEADGADVTSLVDHDVEEPEER